MANLPHLILPQAAFDLPRKKTGFPQTPDRKHGSHGQALSNELQEVLTGFKRRRRPAGIDPSLILQVKQPADRPNMTGYRRWESSAHARFQEKHSRRHATNAAARCAGTSHNTSTKTTATSGTDGRARTATSTIKPNAGVNTNNRISGYNKSTLVHKY